MYFLANKIIPLIFSIPLINFLLEFDTLKQIQISNESLTISTFFFHS